MTKKIINISQLPLHLQKAIRAEASNLNLKQSKRKVVATASNSKSKVIATTELAAYFVKEFRDLDRRSNRTLKTHFQSLMEGTGDAQVKLSFPKPDYMQSVKDVSTKVSKITQILKNEGIKSVEVQMTDELEFEGAHFGSGYEEGGSFPGLYRDYIIKGIPESVISKLVAQELYLAGGEAAEDTEAFYAKGQDEGNFLFGLGAANLEVNVEDIDEEDED